MTNYITAKDLGGSYSVEANEIWNIPTDTNDVHFEHEAVGHWTRGLRGVCMTIDRKIFGMRTMHDCRESGYCMEGRVSIGGKKYRAFTSSTLFERPDGSLVSVATLVVCGKF